MSQRPPVEKLKLFNLTIRGLAKPSLIKDLKYRKSLIVLKHFIKRNLKQFHLEQVDFYDVVSEVYLRGTKLIASGEEIKNPGAWIRVTSYNVIREMSRKQNKERANSELVEFQIFPNNCEDNNEEDIEILKMSFQHLSEKDRQIIELRFFQKLSWKEVVTYLASTGEILAEANARQKGKRALERLKKAFLSIKSDKLSA